MPDIGKLRTIQLWPGGRSVAYVQDDRKMWVRFGAPGAGSAGLHEATPEEAKEITRCLLAEQYLNHEVHCCDSSLVTDAMGLGGGSDFAEEWTFDKVTNLEPDPSDWTLEQCKEWLEDEGHDLPDVNNPYDEDRDGLLAMLGDDDETEDKKDPRADEELLAQAVDGINCEAIDGLDDWRQAVRDNASPYEIYEWWRVSGWLADQLKSIGQPVLDNAYGTWWGRCCTGQSMLMDGTLQKVAALFD